MAVGNCYHMRVRTKHWHHAKLQSRRPESYPREPSAMPWLRPAVTTLSNVHTGTHTHTETPEQSTASPSEATSTSLGSQSLRDVPESHPGHMQAPKNMAVLSRSATSDATSCSCLQANKPRTTRPHQIKASVNVGMSSSSGAWRQKTQQHS